MEGKGSKGDTRVFHHSIVSKVKSTAALECDSSLVLLAVLTYMLNVAWLLDVEIIKTSVVNMVFHR